MKTVTSCSLGNKKSARKQSTEIILPFNFKLLCAFKVISAPVSRCKNTPVLEEKLSHTDSDKTSNSLSGDSSCGGRGLKKLEVETKGEKVRKQTSDKNKKAERATGILRHSSSVKVNSRRPHRNFSKRARLNLRLWFEVEQRQKLEKHRWLQPKSFNFWTESVESEVSLLKSQDGHSLNLRAEAKYDERLVLLCVCLCVCVC